MNVKYRNLEEEKDYDEDDPNRWILPFADFITLLFAVFVVMYAVSNVEESKFKSLSESLSVALNVKESQDNFEIIQNSKNNSLIQKQSKSDNFIELSANLQNDLAPLIADKKIRIIKSTYGIEIEINDSFLFKSGQADLDFLFTQPIREIADILKKYPNQIEVEGHTDDAKISSAVYPSNWELSAARASSVIRALIANGVPEKQLAAIGYAATRPIDTNSTEEGRYRNRRVAIKILGNTKAPQ
jgi:chemotaxis protein MotB